MDTWKFVRQCSFGQLLRDCRLGAGISQNKLGAHLGVSAPYISDVERGNREPLNRERVKLAAELLEVDPWPLFVSAVVSREAMRVDLTGLNDRQLEALAALLWRINELGDSECVAVCEAVGGERVE